MAMVPLCYKTPSKEQLLSIPKLLKHRERGFKCGCIPRREGSRFIATSANKCKIWHAKYPTAEISTKAKEKKLMNASGGAVCNREPFPKQNVAELPVLRKMCNFSCVECFSKRASPKENLCMVCYASEPSTVEGQIRLLESYLAKLKDDDIQTSSESSGEMTEVVSGSEEINAKKELDSLDAYLGKVHKDATSSTYDNQTTERNLMAARLSVGKYSKRREGGELKGYRELRSKDEKADSERHLALLQNDETSDLCLISIMVSINIAVSLFEIASPIRNSDFEVVSLPLLYGAKINDLILVGEWWRLVTPMFLHSGLLHVALSCWTLLTFGPRVFKSYGSCTFFLIYTLGGISGNLISFLHTPQPTVGGTGPVFAIIGAWLIYQIQNKDVVAKDDIMFQKAMLATALSLIISNFGPVDNWAHFGAAFTGIAYGFFTCPILQLDDASSRTSQEERITLVREYASPCKSLVIFTIFLIGLSSLLFFFEPTLDTLTFR